MYAILCHKKMCQEKIQSVNFRCIDLFKKIIQFEMTTLFVPLIRRLSLWGNIKIYFQKKGKDSALKRTSNKIPESSYLKWSMFKSSVPLKTGLSKSRHLQDFIEAFMQIYLATIVARSSFDKLIINLILNFHVHSHLLFCYAWHYAWFSI